MNIEKTITSTSVHVPSTDWRVVRKGASGSVLPKKLPIRRNDPLIRQQNLLLGADWEIEREGATDIDSALTTVAKNLRGNPDHYKNLFSGGDPGKPARRVASVAVIHDGKILMGKRRDNGKWTMPGGHVDEEESMHEGALRELEEEAGIRASSLDELTPVKKVLDQEKKGLHLQGFVLELKEKPPTSMQDDPDGEVERWNWIPLEDGIPEEIAGNLHVPPERNIVLQGLGLVEKSGGGEVGGNVDGLLDDEAYFVDLGSGNARASGHLGYDTYPYDYGTVVHDLNTGIPLPDQSVSSLRMTNSLHEIENKKLVLKEAHRVTRPGARFVYEGQEDISELVKDLPGFVMTNYEENQIEKNGQSAPYFRQEFERVPVQPDPATSNDAEPYLGQSAPLDSRTLLQANDLEYGWVDGLSSAQGNRASGYTSQGSMQPTRDVPPVGAGGPAVQPTYKKRAKVFKADKFQQIVYGVILEPNLIDEQGDWMRPEEIEKTAHNYLEHYRHVGSQHRKFMEAVVVESYIAPQDLNFEGQYGPQKVKQGSWVLGVKIKDPAEWAKVLSGEYQGFSVGGDALRK